MTTTGSRWLARILTPLMIIAAATGTWIALAGSASAANNICTSYNTSGFSDPTCGPFFFSGSGGGTGPGGNSGTTCGTGTRFGDLTAAAHSEWGAPLWSGTFYEDSRENLFRTGAFATSPCIQTTTTFYSSSLFGFHGCAQAFAYDSAHQVVYDSGEQRVGVDGGNSFTWTYGARLGVDRANSIASLAVVQRQC